MVEVYRKSSNSRSEQHPEGSQLHVADGHLHVLDSRSTSIAIYAPGDWTHAEVKGS